MTSPLIENLKTQYGFPDASITNIEELVNQHKHLVLFFPGNPERYPEANDVAVILPELIQEFAGRLSPAVVQQSDQDELKEHYAFNQWPSLVFLRRGVQLGVISKVQNWTDYIERINSLLASEDSAEESIPLVSV